MKKEEYLSALEKRLSGLPAKERKERLRFFGEMIDDRIEDGCSEEDAVQELGSVEELAATIADITKHINMTSENCEIARNNTNE